MKISDRFTDYGLIGGFFWLLQLAIWSIYGLSSMGPGGLFDWLKTLLVSVPTHAIPSFSALIGPLVALLGALAVIAIFTTGLLLDLLGSWLFRPLELLVFVGFLRRNRRWLERIFNQNQDYIQEDWSVLSEVPPPWGKAALSIGLNAALRAYTRVQSFLLSYVLLTSGTEKIELLSTQMSLWSTSRAIATAMLLGSLSSLLYLVSGKDPQGIHHHLIRNLALYAVQIILTFGASVVDHSAHARVCSTVFALAYVIYGKSPLPSQRSAPE